MYTATSATKKVLRLNKRIRAIQGGTSASKTVSILLVLINAAQSDKTPTLTSIVSESFPHLRRGVMRDFLLIMQVQGYFNDSRWDKTNSIYTFATGSQIEFFSVDQSEKVRGARRERLFINECNNVSFAAFEELEVRTKECVYLDWNGADGQDGQDADETALLAQITALRDEFEARLGEFEVKSNASAKNGVPVIYGPGKTKLIVLDLSAQLNGSTKTFQLGTNFGIVNVSSSSSPFGAFRPVIDYNAVGKTIVFTASVDAPSALVGGQSLIVTILK